jgi:SAM-dependent methyltransferase
VEERVSDPFLALARTRTGKWTFWKFNWLANHKLIRALERARTHAHGTLLDVGCGARSFEPLFQGHVSRYLGTDLASSRFLGAARPDVYSRAEALPIRESSVDTVLGLSMLTYLPEPSRMVEEARRVLRPGGTLILEFTQMAPLHDEPYDFFRFTEYGARSLLERNGFEVMELIPIGGLMSRVGLTAIAGLNRINRGPTRVITELPVRALYVLVQLTTELLDHVFPTPREPLAHLAVARRRD